MKIKKYAKLTIWQLLAIGYLAVILLGSILLVLPFSSKEGTSYLDALFVSTSATCVTGLVPFDTDTHWTLFGKIVILLLIQTGGLGFMTFVSAIIGLFGKQMSLYGKKVLMLSSGESSLTGLRHLIRRIVLSTLIFEGIGAALLMIRFVPQFGAEGIFLALWHSVSAFCNAGFDIMGGKFGQYCSLTHYATDPLVVLTVVFLIVAGGTGFCVWSDLVHTKLRWKKLRLYSKIILVVNGALLLVSTLLFLLFERNNPECVNMNFGEKLLVALFNATTTRTAGFNTVDFGKFSDSGYLISLILMFVGGCSGSTAGGVKVNTLAVIFLGMFTAFRGKTDVNVGNKRLDAKVVSQALAVFVSCLFLVMFATLAICAIEQSASFKSVLFETVSAMGTVGLSLSLTPTLCSASKIIIMLLMFAGRVGILTIAMAFGQSKSTYDIRKPLDDTVIIG